MLAMAMKPTTFLGSSLEVETWACNSQRSVLCLVGLLKLCSE